MFIEALQVCVGYSDFLTETLKYNLPHLDRVVIVTTPGDEETREACRRYSVECLLTDEGVRDGEFNKGWMIERGLRMLSRDGWRLHLDADCVLPARFRHLLDAADLDEQKVYGCDRVMVKSWDQWQSLLGKGWLHSHRYHNNLPFPEGYPVGSRWVDIDTGWTPIGFFQLWHSAVDQWRGVRTLRYPTRHNSACRTDTQHTLQLDRRRRELLPEVIVAHLESEPSPLGVNWSGRKSKRFGPASASSTTPTPATAVS